MVGHLRPVLWRLLIDTRASSGVSVARTRHRHTPEVAFAAAADHWRTLAQYYERLAADQPFNDRKLLVPPSLGEK